jgi:hypothetical protein
MNTDVLLNIPVEDIVAQVVSQYGFNVPMLHREQAHLEETRYRCVFGSPSDTQQGGHRYRDSTFRVLDHRGQTAIDMLPSLFKFG